MHINLTKVALLVAAYYLFRQGEQMTELRTQLRVAEAKLNDITVA